MEEDRHICIYIKNTRVEGYITYAGREVLHIKILRPFNGIIGKTMVIPNYISLDEGYLDTHGYITKRGISAAQRVLHEIYEGILFVQEEKENFLKLYNNYRNREHLPAEEELNEEAFYYPLFTYTLTVYHRKISYDIFKQLIKEFVIKS